PCLEDFWGRPKTPPKKAGFSFGASPYRLRCVRTSACHLNVYGAGAPSDASLSVSNACPVILAGQFFFGKRTRRPFSAKSSPGSLFILRGATGRHTEDPALELGTRVRRGSAARVSTGLFWELPR